MLLLPRLQHPGFPCPATLTRALDAPGSGQAGTSESRDIGQDMQRGPPRPLPSSLPEIAITSIPRGHGPDDGVTEAQSVIEEADGHCALPGLTTPCAAHWAGHREHPEDGLPLLGHRHWAPSLSRTVG